MITAMGKKLEWREGLTIQDVLKALGYDYPRVLVRVDSQIIKRKAWGSFRIQDGSTVDVHRIMAGG